AVSGQVSRHVEYRKVTTAGRPRREAEVTTWPAWSRSAKLADGIPGGRRAPAKPVLASITAPRPPPRPLSTSARTTARMQTAAVVRRAIRTRTTPPAYGPGGPRRA